MKKPNSISDQDRRLLEQLDALVGDMEPSSAELAAELEACEVDPKGLRESVFQRIRAYATEQYSSRGVDLPPMMSGALKQMRPPTSQEQEAARTERAASRVQNLLASLRRASESLSPNISFAPAYRNKQEDTPGSDEELLRQQQEDLDRKAKRETND